MKLKAYELMIFNFVYENGVPIILDKWEFKGHVIDDECKNILPIPLTISWLKDLGFTQVENEINEHGWNTFENNGIIIKQHDKIFGYLENDAPLNYVHQLQNLYFALTGQELQYKPE